MSSINPRTCKYPLCIGLLAILAFIPGTARSQIQLGLLGGANFASLADFNAGNNVNAFSNRTGYHLGAFLDIGGESFGIRPGVYYLNAGPLFEGATFINEDQFNLNYVAIPIDLRFNLGSGLIRPYLVTGPEFHVLASNNIPGDLKDKLNSFVANWSVGAGIAIDVPVAGVVLYPQLRYNFDISGIADKEFEVGGVPVTTNGRTSSLLLLSLGIGF